MVAVVVGSVEAAVAVDVVVAAAVIVLGLFDGAELELAVVIVAEPAVAVLGAVVVEVSAVAVIF